MEDATRVAIPDLGNLAAEVARLRADLDGLRADLDGLRAELATEVRTRRVVVVDDLNRERIYTEVRDDVAKLDVACRDKNNYMSLFAVEEDGTTLGVDAWGDGNPFGGYFAYRVPDDDVTEASKAIGIAEWGAQLEVYSPNSRTGLVVDADGVKLHPARLYQEKCAYTDSAREVRNARATEQFR